MARQRVVAILQARLSSSRLPGKVLMPFHGQPMIAFMIARLRLSKCIDELVVATSDEASDAPLVAAMEAINIKVVRGPLDDVLARFLLAATITKADIIVRLTADCPLIDVAVVDSVISAVIDGADYASNVDPASFPDGLDCEAFTYDQLQRADREARIPSQREHVTPFMRECDSIRRAAIVSSIDLSDIRWTVDYEDDLAYVRAIVEAVNGNPIIADRYDFLRAADLIAPSFPFDRHTRNEGYAKSLANDRKVVS
jgi:spore coat polysaccharide biosynthesis protein SpsF (cytidylyltransferase family)